MSKDVCKCRKFSETRRHSETSTGQKHIQLPDKSKMMKCLLRTELSFCVTESRCSQSNKWSKSESELHLVLFMVQERTWSTGVTGGQMSASCPRSTVLTPWLLASPRVKKSTIWRRDKKTQWKPQRKYFLDKMSHFILRRSSLVLPWVQSTGPPEGSEDSVTRNL